MDSRADRVPTREELCLPILRVLQQGGGSASIREISEDLAALLELPDAVREVAHGNGPQTEFDYQAAWARTFLKYMDAATNSSRGVWSITAYGRELTAKAATAEADVQGEILGTFDATGDHFPPVGPRTRPRLVRSAARKTTRTPNGQTSCSVR